MKPKEYLKRVNEVTFHGILATARISPMQVIFQRGINILWFLAFFASILMTIILPLLYVNEATFRINIDRNYPGFREDNS